MRIGGFIKIGDDNGGGWVAFGMGMGK